jgi:thymidylate synthase (FAD)
MTGPKEPKEKAMNRIGVTILNPEVFTNMRNNMAFAARVTQKGHLSAEGLDKEPSEQFIKNMCSMPHPTLQKFDLINVMFHGVSRRFLAQITRHQDMKFASSSFRYGNHSEADFVVPYEIITQPNIVSHYKAACISALSAYKNAVDTIGNDAAGYLLPSSTRVNLMASATPFQWKHVISQRICNRCGHEIRYTMLMLWEMLYDSDPIIFAPETTSADCMKAGTICTEGKMRCPLGYLSSKSLPKDILDHDYRPHFPGRKPKGGN